MLFQTDGGNFENEQLIFQSFALDFNRHQPRAKENLSMKKKQRTEITFETHEVTVIRFRRSIKLYCETCRKLVPHLRLESASGLFPETELSRAAADGQIHSTLAGGDGRLFCGVSLAAFEAGNKE